MKLGREELAEVIDAQRRMFFHHSCPKFVGDKKTLNKNNTAWMNYYNFILNSDSGLKDIKVALQEHETLEEYSSLVEKSFTKFQKLPKWQSQDEKDQIERLKKAVTVGEVSDKYSSSHFETLQNDRDSQGRLNYSHKSTQKERM